MRGAIALVQERLLSILTNMFGGLALLLAAIGVRHRMVVLAGEALRDMELMAERHGLAGHRRYAAASAATIAIARTLEVICTAAYRL
jgi:hypothetical protein